jgi:hypothetical protein
MGVRVEIFSMQHTISGWCRTSSKHNTSSSVEIVNLLRVLHLSSNFQLDLWLKIFKLTLCDVDMNFLPSPSHCIMWLWGFRPHPRILNLIAE